MPFFFVFLAKSSLLMVVLNFSQFCPKILESKYYLLLFIVRMLLCSILSHFPLIAVCSLPHHVFPNNLQKLLIYSYESSYLRNFICIVGQHFLHSRILPLSFLQCVPSLLKELYPRLLFGTWISHLIKTICSNLKVLISPISFTTKRVFKPPVSSPLLNFILTL